MKPVEIRLLKEQDKSFLLYHEKNPFSRWHHHPDFELVLIVNGRGKRTVGDHIATFEEGDLVLMGPHLPHEWRCDEEYFHPNKGFIGEGIVIQFLDNFLGETFFGLPENRSLQKLLVEAQRGCLYYGETKTKVTELMAGMLGMKGTDRLYELFKIFRVLADSRDYSLLASLNFVESFRVSGDEPIQKAVEYILQNFQEKVCQEDLLKVTNMSSTAFSVAFKKNYGMSFKQYQLQVRIGYACRLLTEGIKNVTEVAYQSGFENLSNFNRQFKKIKKRTPSEFRDLIK